MTEPRLTREQAEQLVANFRWVSWQFDFRQDGTRPAAEMRLAVEGHAKDRNSRRRAPHWRSLQGVSVIAAVFAVLTSLATFSAIAISCLAIFVVTAIASYLRARKLEGYVKTVDAVIELVRRVSVKDRVEQSWVQAIREDPETHSLAVNWFLAKSEIDQLEVRIDEGVQARKKLSPVDPMRRILQVEIETLRSRRDMLHADRQEQAESITQAAREYFDKKNREFAEEQRRRKHEARLREIGDKEQARLQAQERAQNWLHGEK